MKKNLLVLVSIFLAIALTACAVPGETARKANEKKEVTTEESQKQDKKHNVSTLITNQGEELEEGPMRNAYGIINGSKIYIAYDNYFNDNTEDIVSAEAHYFKNFGRDYEGIACIEDICGNEAPELAFIAVDEYSPNGGGIFKIRLEIVGFDGEDIVHLLERKYVVGAGGGSAWSLFRSSKGHYYLAEAAAEENLAVLKYFDLSTDISKATSENVLEKRLDNDGDFSFYLDGETIDEKTFATREAQITDEGRDIIISNTMHNFAYLAAALNSPEPSAWNYDAMNAYLESKISETTLYESSLPGKYYSADDGENCDLRLTFDSHDNIVGHFGCAKKLEYDFVAIPIGPGEYEFLGDMVHASLEFKDGVVYVVFDKDYLIDGKITADDLLGRRKISFEQ